MAQWKSEEVLNRWTAKGNEYGEEHISEMREEIDAAFHEDITSLLEKNGVNTDGPSMNTVGIIKALDRLISGSGS